MSEEKRLPYDTCSIATLVHGEYLVEPASAPRSPLLVGFHGYGETAASHLEEMRALPGIDGWTLCAVQGLHAFYKRSNGEVVRSWMTKENRQVTIEDNIRYVAAVISEVRRRHGADQHLVFSGFSQGVAMTWRAVVRCGFRAHGVLALAGDVPPEVPGWAAGPMPPTVLGRGLDDAWYNEEKMNDDVEVLEKLGTRVISCVFDGGHVWHDDYREAAGRLLAEIRSGT